MNEVQDEYKGCRIFGSAVGDKPAYQYAGRVEIPLSWGVIDVPIQPSGVFDTQADASALEIDLTQVELALGSHSRPLTNELESRE